MYTQRQIDTKLRCMGREKLANLKENLTCTFCQDLRVKFQEFKICYTQNPGIVILMQMVSWYDIYILANLGLSLTLYYTFIFIVSIITSLSLCIFSIVWDGSWYYCCRRLRKPVSQVAAAPSAPHPQSIVCQDPATFEGRANRSSLQNA